MPPEKTDASLEGLNSLTGSAVALIQQLENALHQIGNSNNPDAAAETSSSTVSIDALALARDAAQLIRAHSTKISVLIINEPFTPSAIIKVLRELVGSAVPGLASAAQACTADRYTLTVRKDLAWKGYLVLKELRELVQRIPRDGKILSSDQKNGAASVPGKGSMAATGVVWSACDEVIRFANAGVGGCFVTKVEEFRDTLKDVMEELKEWGDEEPEEEDDDEDDSADDHDSALGSMMVSTQEMLDDIMGDQKLIPRDDPDHIRDKLESCLKRMRLTTLLYQAIVKRRLKILPSLPREGSGDIISRLANVMAVLRKLPDQFDDLAGAFYELNPAVIDAAMDQCFLDVSALADLLKKPWEQETDEFTEWAEKFQGQIKKT
jgi:hypothetical protein